MVRLRRPLVLRGRRQDGAKLCRVGGGGPNRGLSRPRLSSWLIIPSVFCFLLGAGAFVWLYLQMSWSFRLIRSIVVLQVGAVGNLGRGAVALSRLYR